MLSYGIKKLTIKSTLVSRVNDPEEKGLFFTKANLDFFCPIEDSVTT